MAYNLNLMAADWLGLGQSYAIDFLIAFTFFCALCFAILSRRFEHRRSAAMMSAALGAALAIGLMTWQVRTGWRISDLGPIAAGFGLIVLAMVIHQAIRRVGGHWAGAAVALGATILISSTLNIPWPVSDQTLSAVSSLILIMGAGLWLLHHGRGTGLPSNAAAMGTGDQTRDLTAARFAKNQVHEIDDVRRVEKQIGRSIDTLEQATRAPPQSQQQLTQITQQLAQLIPAEGHVTKRLAGLRARAALTRNGHLARLRALSKQIPRMTPAEARLGAQRVRAAYRAAGFDRRIERLDAAAVEVERRVQRLTAQAQALARAGQIEHLHELLKQAQKLQAQEHKLLKIINRDEKRLFAMAIKELKKMAE